MFITFNKTKKKLFAILGTSNLGQREIKGIQQVLHILESTMPKLNDTTKTNQLSCFLHGRRSPMHKGMEEQGQPQRDGKEG